MFVITLLGGFIKSNQDITHLHMITHESMCTFATTMWIFVGILKESQIFSCAARHCPPCTSGLNACMVFLLTDWVFSKMNTEMAYMVEMTIHSGEAAFVAKSSCHWAIASWNFGNSHCIKFQCQQENNAVPWHKACKHSWCSLHIDACTPPQPCLHTPFTTPNPTSAPTP